MDGQQRKQPLMRFCGVSRLLADYIRKTMNNKSSDPVVDSSSTAERFVTRLGRRAAAGRRRHFVVAFTT